MKIFLKYILIIAMTIMFAGCEPFLSGKIKIKYIITGSADDVSIKYIKNSDGDYETSSISLPWTYEFSQRIYEEDIADQNIKAECIIYKNINNSSEIKVIIEVEDKIEKAGIFNLSEEDYTLEVDLPASDYENEIEWF